MEMIRIILFIHQIIAHDFILANHKAYILSQSGPKTVLSRRRRSSSILNNENRAGSGIEYYDAIFSATGFGSKLFLDSFIIDDSFTAVSGIFPDHRFVDYLHQQSNVEYVEPNQVYKAQIIRPLQEYQLMNSTSSYTQRLQAFANGTRRRGTIKTAVAPNWGQARVTQREHGGDLSQYEYDEAAGESVHVYVLDTGINTAHQDFEGRAVIDANFIDYEEGEDLGGHGKQFSQTAAIYSLFFSILGTHVASKIAGQLYGIAKKAKIHSVKILDRSGDGTTSTLLKGISHVIKTAEPGKSLINLSLSGPRSRMIDEILSKAATQYNIPIFASAGNSGSDACFFSPASNPDVLSVGASDLNDDVAAYSDVGECVKVYAPGSGIESAWIGAPNSSKLLDGTR
jgi:subtilisin family serine protease